MHYNENQLDPKLLAICGMNFVHQHNSASRVHMTSNHLGQCLVINGATERRFQSGMEREYGKYTFNVKMPENGTILHTIDRYPASAGQGSIDENPQTVVIYEEAETRKVGIINLTGFCCNHQYFGFPYAPGKDADKLRVGQPVPKDAVFLESPNVTNEGGYKYGIQGNVVYMTHPATSEDGVLICSDFLPKLGFKTYETRVVEFGSTKFARNLYGDRDEHGNVLNFKAYPDIGQRIRSDGLLMALVPNEPAELAIVEQSVLDLTEVDAMFDQTVYVDGPGGIVRDIRIHHSLNRRNHAPVHMDEQSQKYDNARRLFYDKIMRVWQDLHRLRGDALLITPEFSQLVLLAQSVLSEQPTGQGVSKLHRKAPVDDYWLEFVIEYSITPTTGFKITDLSGGKAVTCAIGRPEDMPRDANGRRADVIFDPNSTIGRMNLGRFYEHYYNSATGEAYDKLCARLGCRPGMREMQALDIISKIPPQELEAHWRYLMRLYEILSPRMHAWFVDGKVEQTQAGYLAEVVNRGITVFMPTNNQPESEVIVAQLEAEYQPIWGPVTYTGYSGQQVTTVEKFRIAEIYLILLEKTGDDWSAVASAKLQHLGVPAQVTKADKYSKPARQQAVRGSGEAEVRIFVSYIGTWFVAELMDRNNNPNTHKHIVANLLRATYPSNVHCLVDRTKIPFGGSKPLQMTSHLASCSGFKFVYKPFKPHQISYKTTV